MVELYDLIRFVHFVSFVFMTVPLFNLIVVNERAALGTSFDYQTDRYLENIIRNGATRCFVFQATVLISGVLLLVYGGLGIDALWTNWVVMAKMIVLFVLMGLLSYVHFSLQPKIDSYLKDLTADTPIPNDLIAQVKPYRVQRKWLATFCLFLVISLIILGLQMDYTFHPVMTIILISLAALFAWKVNKSLIRFGWV